MAVAYGCESRKSVSEIIVFIFADGGERQQQVSLPTFTKEIFRISPPY